MKKESHIKEEIKRLKRLRKLVSSEIKESEKNSDSVDMTIIDLEEWLQEIDQEIDKLSK